MKRQFIVKVKGDQSVSTMPVRGAMPSLSRLGDPPTRRFQPSGAKNAFNVEGDNALPEQRHGEAFRFRARLRPDGNRVDTRFAVPDCVKGEGIENFPAVSIGDVEGQTPIGEDSGVSSIQARVAGAGRI